MEEYASASVVDQLARESALAMRPSPAQQRRQRDRDRRRTGRSRLAPHLDSSAGSNGGERADIFPRTWSTDLTASSFVDPPGAGLGSGQPSVHRQRRWDDRDGEPRRLRSSGSYDSSLSASETDSVDGEASLSDSPSISFRVAPVMASHSHSQPYHKCPHCMLGVSGQRLGDNLYWT